MPKLDWPRFPTQAGERRNPMAGKKAFVSTLGIERAVKKAEKKLDAEKKKAKPDARKKIALELKVLKRINKLCHDVRLD
jgi:hypothetical protein